MITSPAPLVVVVSAILVLAFTRNLFAASPYPLAAQAMAVALSVWARRSFPKGTFRVAAAPGASAIIRRGPYRFVRHPMYSAALLFIWTAVLSHLSLWTLALGAIVTVVAASRFRDHEGLFLTTTPLSSLCRPTSEGRHPSRPPECDPRVSRRTGGVRVDSERVRRVELTATIDGPDATLTTILVRARAVTITGFTITGGRVGIDVGRGASALIDGNTVEGTGRFGITLGSFATANIVNNTIQNNSGHGVLVTGNASGFIGFRTADDTRHHEPHKHPGGCEPPNCCFFHFGPPFAGPVSTLNA